MQIHGQFDAKGLINQTLISHVYMNACTCEKESLHDEPNFFNMHIE